MCFTSALECYSLQTIVKHLLAQEKSLLTALEGESTIEERRLFVSAELKSAIFYISVQSILKYFYFQSFPDNPVSGISIFLAKVFFNLF